MRVPPAGPHSFFTLANFSQRKDFVEAAVTASMTDPKHKAIVAALFAKIGRLWKTRNYLVHSHYVYCRFDKEGEVNGVFVQAGKTLGTHPSKLGEPKYIIGTDQGPIEIIPEKAAKQRFAYQKHLANGTIKHIPVNRGTFETHASQVSKRIRQVGRLKRAIENMNVPLKWASHSSSLDKSSPRALRNQTAYRAHLERTLKRLPPPQS